MNTYFFIIWTYEADGNQVVREAGPYRDPKYASLIAADLPGISCSDKVTISLKERYYSNNKWMDVSDH